MPSPVFVAGHRGLIGSALVRRLVKGGCSDLVTATRRELDLENPEAVRAFFLKHRPGTVFLAAGKVGGIVENRDHPADFITRNLAIQINVLRSAHETGVARLIFFGSSCMYPRDCPQPMAEHMLLSGKPEDTSLPYAISKLAGTQMCLAYNRQYGSTRFLPVIPNSAYGPNDNFDPASSHVLAALIRKLHDAKVAGASHVELWGTGTPRREFVHADDIADGCCFLLEHDVAKIDFPINIGAGVDHSIAELAEIVARVTGYAGTIKWDTGKPDGAPRKLLDGSRLRALGWRAGVKLEDGIRATYRWFLETKGIAARGTVPV
jgi:GDP-L-fucose synthase